MAKLGWHAHEAPAEGSGLGRPGHGGIPLMAPRVHGIGQYEGVGRSIIDVGRATFVHHSGLCSGGMVLVTVHLLAAEGLSRANESIMRKASTMLQVLGRPFIIGGGFNMEP
eukprot:4983528-Pyramimonas_sp.AAC.1